MEPGRQFHGARREIDDTHVRPPSVTGAHPASSLGFSSGSDRPAHTDLAFATPSEHQAWGYARTWAPNKNHPSNNDPDPKHRSRVYEVAPASDQHNDGSEIQSLTGYKILREHHSEVGVTGTFPQVNWNAYKAKPADNRVVSSGDRNHSYMETDPDRPAHVPLPHQEAGAEGTQRYRAPDERHPDQMNLFSGRTVAEHREYENTPGAMLHNKQFAGADFHRDPTTSVIRRSKPWHSVDEALGTVR